MQHLEDREPETQMGRALRRLQTDWITPHSARAKGRVERSFETAQDRLIKLMRLDNIRTIEDRR